MTRQTAQTGKDKSLLGLGPFRRAVLRGLAVVMPPLLTIVFLLWVGNSIQRYILQPVEWAARRVIVTRISDIHDKMPESAIPDAADSNTYEYDDNRYVLMKSGQGVPAEVYEYVRANPGEQFPTTAESLYDRYVEIRWLHGWFLGPVVLSLLILLVYLLGKFMAARLGHMMWSQFEQVINRLPFIRAVYSTVKQVTDIVFGSQEEVTYTRVVAIEYPRKGLWSVGFVTGESMGPIREAAQEPVLSVLMPTSPMPATGFTVTVRKSEAIDLAISVDQAFQFVVSCGVVVPGMGATPEMVEQDIRTALTAQEDSSTKSA